MAGQGNQRQGLKPVIAHQSFANSNIIDMLRDSNYFIRFSNTVIQDTFIFPTSSIAFLIISDDVLHSRRQAIKVARSSFYPSTDHNDHSLKSCEELFKRIEKFAKLHRKCFAILRFSEFDESLSDFVLNIQTRFMETSLQVIPVHNGGSQSVVEAMLNIAKATCKPVCEVLSERLRRIKESFQSSETFLHDILKMLKVNPEEMPLLQDGIGSVEKLVLATEQDLLNCGLGEEVVTRIQEFFN